MANSTSTFASGGGKITTDFGGNDYGFGMAIQADGKILVVGTSDANFAMARYNVDGSLDTSFSADGKVTTDFGNYDYAWGIKIESNGKILISGSSGSDFALACYNVDGSLALNFGSGGKVITANHGMGHAVAFSVQVQTVGKIVTGGFNNGGAGFGNGDFAMVRYKPDGSLDTNFGNAGMVTTDVGHDDYGMSMLIQPDDKILVAGETWFDSGNSDFALVRYNANGSLDTSFGIAGKVTTDFNYRDQGSSMTIQSDGKIIVVGESNGDFALARYNIDGSLDKTFSGDGKVTTDIGKYDFGGGVTIQNDGKILVIGSAYAIQDSLFHTLSDSSLILDETGNSDFALVRYNADGSLDTSFGNGGKVTTDFGGTDFATGVAVLADGKIVVSGTSNGNFALARYNSDGSLDTSTSFSGTSGDDTFHSSTGNEAFYGGAGVDTVIFSGHESDYTITLAGTCFSLKDNVGTDGTDTVVNIEKLQFTDHTLNIATVPTETLLESYRIYKAAFDRAPDYGGLGYWFKVMDHGASLTDIAGGFIGSNEFKAMYGDNPTDSTFVSLLYHHVLGRDLDQGGYDFWMNDLKVETRAQVLAHFSESTENIANVAGVIANGIIYEAYAG